MFQWWSNDFLPFNESTIISQQLLVAIFTSSPARPPPLTDPPPLLLQSQNAVCFSFCTPSVASEVQTSSLYGTSSANCHSAAINMENTSASVWSVWEWSVSVSWVTYDAGDSWWCSTRLECQCWVTSPRSPETGALAPRTPPTSPPRVRDVTRAPLTSAAQRATERSARDGFQSG